MHGLGRLDDTARSPGFAKGASRGLQQPVSQGRKADLPRGMSPGRCALNDRNLGIRPFTLGYCNARKP